MGYYFYNKEYNWYKLGNFSLKNIFGNKTTTTPAPTAATVSTNPDGVSAGKALRTLYTNYKAAGKYDAGNLGNILSTISLVNSCKNLKTNMADKTYWSGFAQGLVMGSESLVTEQISNQVTTQLNNIASKIDTEKIETASQQASAVKSIASDISGLLATFK